MSYDIELGEGDSYDVDVTLYYKNEVINLTDTKVVFCMKNAEEVEYNIICVVKTAASGIVTIPFTTIESDISGLFLGTFILLKGTTVKTIPSEADSYISVFIKKAVYEELPVVLTTPTFSVAAGTYPVTQSVSLSADAGASIYYTTDNSTPTNSSTLYNSAISVSSTETIKAIAYRHGDFPSSVASATYTITRDTVATPSISPVSGYFSPTQEVTITCSTSGSVIHYTTDNTAPTASSPTYSTPITVSATSTVRAIAIKSELLNSSEATARTYTLITEHSVTPVISPSTRYFYPSLTITITCSDPSATIHYTTDGTTPTASSSTYSSSFSVTTTTTVKAITTKTNYLPSTEATAQTYTYMSETSVTPSISPVSGYFYPTQQVTITCSDPTAVIHYTTDNTEPTASSSTYSTPITVSATSTVRAISTRTGYVDSAEATSRTYTLITDTVSTPSISPTQSAFVGSVEVTITCSTSGSSIYYTTNGDTPTASSTAYSSPFSVSSDCTIKAIAIKTGMFNSSVVEQAYAGSMQFTHTGQTFEPKITVTGSPTILWTYADNTTSNLAAPTAKDFGTAATRNTLLTVTPWSALTQINVGYEVAEGSETYSPSADLLAQQNVTSIQGLPLTRTYLQKFFADENPITSLDFTNFTALDSIELYNCTSFSTITLEGCSALKRLNLEYDAISSLDLSDCVSLEDLRGAAQSGTSALDINWGSAGEHVWHLCIRNNAGLTMTVDWSNFKALSQLWMWSCGYTGSLSDLPPTMTSLSAYANAFSSVDLTGGSTNLATALLYNCGLDSATVDGIIKTLDLEGPASGNLTIYNNAAPTYDYHLDSLSSKGWNVQAADVTHTTVEPVLFSLDSQPFEDSFSLTLSCSTTDSVIHYTVDGSTPTASSATYSTAITIPTSTTTVKALAVKTGMANSEITQETYTHVNPTDFTIWNEFYSFGSGASMTSDAINVKSGHLILVHATVLGASATIAITDSQSNTYTQCGSPYTLTVTGNAVTGNWFYTYASATGSLTVTETFTNGGNYNGLRVVECSGVAASSPVNITVNASASTTGAITTTVADDIIFVGWHTNGNDTVITAGTGYTLLTGGVAMTLTPTPHYTISNPHRPAEYKLLSGLASGEQATIGNVSSGESLTLGSWVVALKKHPGIQFTHTGQTFQPIITVTGSPTILWTYADGTTSNLAAPTVKDFGTAATRTTTLLVTPWSALTQINVGYNGEDGGSRYNSDVTIKAQQNVTSITGLSLARTSLVKFAACYNPITSLDVSNFTALEVLECYSCQSLATINVSGTTSLKRLCLERGHLSSLDVSTCTLLEDLRSAQQTTATPFTLTWGSTGTHIWHICVRDNANMVMPITWSNFPALQEILIYGCNLTIPISNLSSTVLDLQAANNAFSSVDITGATRLANVILNNCGLSSATVDDILLKLDSYGVINGNLNLLANGAPTYEYHLNNLTSKGWTAGTVSVSHTRVEPPVFDSSPVNFVEAFDLAVTCPTNDAVLHYTTDGTTPTASSSTYSTSIAISATTTVKVIGVKDGMTDSEVMTKSYTLLDPTDFYVWNQYADFNQQSSPYFSTAINMTEGHMILVFASSAYASTFSVSDSQNNTYTPCGTSYMCDTAGIRGQWFWAIADSTSANTVTLTTDGSYIGLRVIECQGITHTSPVDITVNASGTTTGAITTTVDDDIIFIGWHCSNVYTTPTAVTGYTLLQNNPNPWGPDRPAEYKKITDTVSSEQATITAGTPVGSWVVALKKHPGIQFTHTGQTFQPIITVTGSPTILWTYADGTTSNLAAPTVKDFGTAATRTTYLTVTPWSALTRINVGYDGGDGGARYNSDTATLAQQNVIAIEGLDLVRTSLQKIAISNNPITSLDFTNFTALEVIECYYCGSLTTGIVTGCTALTRLCFEHCHLSTLDLSTNTLLEDLRSAGQGTTNYAITWGGTGAHLWHLCVVDNSGLVMPIDFSNFPSLIQCWMWNCGLTIPLTNLSYTVDSIECSGNAFSDVDLSNFKWGEILLASCGFSSTLVDKILKQMDELGCAPSTLALESNSAPTYNYRKASLISKGWTVNTATVAYTTVEPPVFSVSRNVFDEAFNLSLTCSTTDAVIHYTLDGSTPTASSATYSTALPISATTTIKAIAVKAGMANSEVSAETYTLIGATDFAIWNQSAVYPGTQSEALNVKQGHMILAFASSAYATGFSIADTQNNTYTPCGEIWPSVGVKGNWYWAIASATGANTVSLTTDGQFISFRVIECSGITNTNPVDITVNASGTQSGAITTTVADDIIFVGWHVTDEYHVLPEGGTGYTILQNNTDIWNIDRPAEYKQVTGTVSGEHATIFTTGQPERSWVVALKKATA